MNKKYGLKGGLALCGIVLVLTVILMLLFGFEGRGGHPSFPIWIIPYLPGVALMMRGIPGVLGYVVFFGVPMLIYFGIGALIGSIYGRYKNWTTKV